MHLSDPSEGLRVSAIELGKELRGQLGPRTSVVEQPGIGQGLGQVDLVPIVEQRRLEHRVGELK